MTILRKQAQLLLEQADSLQIHHDLQIVELQRFVPTIINKELNTMLHHPSKEYPKPPRFTEIIRTPLSPQTRLKISNRLVASQNSPSRQTAIPVTSRGLTYQTTEKTTYRCFQCGSTEHIKWFCTKYRWPFCRTISPGHSQAKCPTHPQPEDQTYEHNYHLGHYDIDGDDDGNLTGEH